MCARVCDCVTILSLCSACIYGYLALAVAIAGGILFLVDCVSLADSISVSGMRSFPSSFPFPPISVSSLSPSSPQYS